MSAMYRNEQTNGEKTHEENLRFLACYVFCTVYNVHGSILREFGNVLMVEKERNNQRNLNDILL